MAMTFTTKPVAAAPAQEEYSFDRVELLAAAEALDQAWIDLTDEQKNIAGVQEIMDNIHQSTALIKQYGKDAIPMLNADGGLEALLGIPEKLITIEKAQEGFGEAAKKTALFIEEWFFRICGYILKVMSWVIGFYGLVRAWVGAFLIGISQLLSNVSDETFLAIAKQAKYKRSQISTEGKLDGEYNLAHPILKTSIIGDAGTKIDELSAIFKEVSQSLNISKIEIALANENDSSFEEIITKATEKLGQLSDELQKYNEAIDTDLNDTDSTAFEKGYRSTETVREMTTACKNISEKAEILSTSIDKFVKTVDAKKKALIAKITKDDPNASKKSTLIKSWASAVVIIVKSDLALTKSVRSIFMASRGGLKDLATLVSRNA